MKLFGKLLIAVLIIGMLLPFTVLKGKDGKPLMSIGNLSLPDISMPDFSNLSPDQGSISVDGKDLVYKWVDSEGNLQFSTSPPSEGIEYTVKGYDPNTNLIQAVEVPKAADSESKEPDSKKRVTSADDIGNAYSPEQIEKLFEDAKNVEKLLNERFKNQEAIVGQ